MDLGTLVSQYPPSAHWSEPEPFTDRIDASGVRLRRAGLVTRDTEGQEAVGSAASMGEDPLLRAYFELLERAATLDAIRRARARWTVTDDAGTEVGVATTADLFPPPSPHERFHHSRSNGIALHTDPREARRRAELELRERDAVLRSWYGGSAPRPLRPPEELAPLEGDYEVRACALDTRTSQCAVAVVIGFPKDPAVPLLRGFGAREELDAALAAAASELLQGLAFLWDEAIPELEPDPSATPMYHLDRYLWPGSHGWLRGWLAGEHVEPRSPGSTLPPAGEARFVDITPPWLAGRLCVVKALASGAVPLLFGEGPCWLTSGLPPVLRAHPVA